MQTEGAFSNNTLTLTKSGGGSVDINFPETSSIIELNIYGSETGDYDANYIEYCTPTSTKYQQISFRKCGNWYHEPFDIDMNAIGNLPCVTKNVYSSQSDYFENMELSTYSSLETEVKQISILDPAFAQEVFSTIFANLPDGTYDVSICPSQVEIGIIWVLVFMVFPVTRIIKNGSKITINGDVYMPYPTANFMFGRLICTYINKVE